jgi:phosphoribosylformylglycinamidine cyclo-ligase
MTGVHDTIGIDLVAMCVNDALCCGAEPLFFLDYVAMPKDDPAVLEQIVQGISDGCLQADCALLGGETAILPGVYQPGEYDLAGFCVGVAERRQIIDGKAIAPGDVVLGVASSGLHSNGYSLVRKVVFEKAGLTADQHINELGRTVAEALLTPTRIYAQPVRKILQSYGGRRIVHGVAHITGGGLAENLARIVPASVRVRLAPNSWAPPPVFTWLQRLGDIAPEEMERVFNCGVGLVLVFNPHFQRNIQEILAENGMESWTIGEVVEGPGDVVWGQ